MWSCGRFNRQNLQAKVANFGLKKVAEKKKDRKIQAEKSQKIAHFRVKKSQIREVEKSQKNRNFQVDKSSEKSQLSN